jgi:hypothetical protein
VWILKIRKNRRRDVIEVIAIVVMDDNNMYKGKIMEVLIIYSLGGLTLIFL